MELCIYCATIPFEELPAENEAALPHQPDLECLLSSAKTCRLCALISEAVEKLQRDIQEPGKHVLAHFDYWKSDHENVRVHVDQGSRREFFQPYPTKTDVERRLLFPNGPIAKQQTGPIRPWLYGNWWTVPSLGSSPKLLGMGVRIGRGPSPFDAEGQKAGEVYLRGSALRLQTCSGTYFVDAVLSLANLILYCPLSRTIPVRRRIIHDGKPNGLMKARSWLVQCDEDHSCMDGYDNPKMPTRVIAVDPPPSNTVRLVEGSNKSGRYIALSHCWGTSHRVTLTKANIESLKEGLSTKGLPKTFRDAILIAQLLGVRFIWIDSLCIIQDDPADWEKEAATMCEVYANAYFTVAASSSLDDDSGCFPGRIGQVNTQNVSIECQTLGRPYSEYPVMIEYSPGGPQLLVGDLEYVQITDNSRYDLLITREWLPPSTKNNPLPFVIGAFGELFDPLMNEPLSKRGWCLQERLLSRRTLHFATSQMFWECACGIQSEDGCLFPRLKPDGSALVEDVGTLAPKALRTLLPFAVKLAEEPLLLSGIEGIKWRTLVSEYSRRNLTYDQDKLSAVAGLARKYAALTGKTYFAGLWQDTLDQDLCWRVYLREEILETSCENHDRASRYGKTISTLKVPEQYVAPSWSWASINASVVFERVSEETRLFSPIYGQVERAGTDLFGKVKSGKITLQGPLLGILSPSPDEEPVRQPSYGVPLVAYFPYYYFVKANISDILDDMPYVRSWPNFSIYMEKLARGIRWPKSDLNVCRQAGENTTDYDEGCLNEENMEDIKLYMQQLDVSFKIDRDGVQSEDVRFLDAMVAHSKLVVTGVGYFDVEPKFPCAALFLDDRSCLLLEQTENEYRDYRRVGLGYFQPEGERIQPVSGNSPTSVVSVI